MQSISQIHLFTPLFVLVAQAVKELQQQVLDGELTGWKREQQLAGNGLQMTLSLETIQVSLAPTSRLSR
jgi:STAT protein, all-alpha domain